MRPLVRRSLAALAATLLFGLSPASAQFGQNKIAYDRFEWKVYPSPHFDVYYYGSEEKFLDEIVSYAESAYLQLSRDLDHELRFRVPLVIYKTHAEFEQTNITLSEVPEAVGAFAEPVQNRMVLPIDQPPDKLYELIAHELTHIFQYSIFYEGYLGRALRARPPLWIMEGMASYLAKDEDNIDRMVIRDAVVNNVLPPIEQLDVLSFLTYRYGHAVFDFIEQEFGKEGFRNFVFEFRRVLLTNNVAKAVKEAFGYEPGEFDRRFNRYLRRKYFPVLLEKKSPDDYGKEIGIRRPGVFTFSPTISPSGELVAVLASPKLELDLVVLSAEDGKKIRNVTKGWTNEYQYLVAEAFAGKRDLSWSPAGDQIAVFARKENDRRLLVYDALKGKLLREISLGDLAQCASPAFSPDGRRIAFEGNLEGVVDIFEIDLETREIRNLTQDDFYDANPWYSADGTTVLYNRRIGEYWKIFTVDGSDPVRKQQLTFGPSSDIQPSFSRDGKTIYFSSDRGEFGVFNIHALDTQTGDIRQYTDVVGGCFAPVEMAERNGEPYLVFAAFFGGTFRLYRMPVLQAEGVVEAAESAAPPVEAEPFEPPLTLTADTGKIEPYKLRWDLEAPLIQVGVADDGTLLTNAALQFSDLLGDHRVTIQAASIASYTNTQITYANRKHRTNWGAAVYDFRDYYVTSTGFSLGSRNQIQRTTGASFFVEHPFSRHYRIQGSTGILDRSQDLVRQDPLDPLFFSFARISDRYATAAASIVGDTTRYQSFGPFQGKRLNVGFLYGYNLGADGGGVIPDQQLEGDLTQWNVDFRTYKQLTRRSVLAWRLAGIFNVGERESYYGLGGINQLRGYEFREFFGSNVAWSNLEFRYPLVDEMRFPILAIRQIRGFFFFDAGAAWFQNDEWYDPDLRTFRVAATGRVIPFDPWDSQNNRLQDARASYGFGFQFFFLGGLQFNWSWARRLPFTRYVPDGTGDLVPVRDDGGGRRMEFYIVFDY